MDCDKNKYEFFWRIENFNANLPEIGNKIMDSKCFASPNFSFYIYGYTQWYLELYPKTGRNSAFIKCLPICSDYGKDLTVSCEVSFLRGDNSVHLSKKITVNCSAVFHCDFSNAVEIERAKLPLEKDLILRCVLSFSERAEETVSCDVKGLSQDLHSLWENSTATDITLSVERDKIQAHRTILCIRAPKFAEIHEIQDGDNFNSNIEVSDISFSALKVLIEYLYTGKINKTNDMLSQLYEAATKYNLDQLKYELQPVEARSEARSKVNVKKEMLFWKINDFSNLLSPVTRLIDTKSCRFEVSLIPTTNNSQLCLKMVHFPESNQMYLKCRMSVIDNQGSSNFTSDHINFFESEKLTKKIDEVNKEKWEFPTLIKKSNLTSNRERYLPAGTLNLKLEFEVTEGEITSEIVETRSFSKAGISSISHLNYVRDDFFNIFKARNRRFVGGDYYDGDCYSDVTLKVEEKEIGCHKSVLCARSKVFSELLHNIKRGRITISDTDYETILLMVQYIYSGKLGNLAGIEMARLLIAGEKYQIIQLSDSCHTLLEKSFTIHNFCEILSLADKKSSDKLNHLAFNYIRKNRGEVLNSKEWEEFVDKCPVLSTKVYSSVCENENRRRDYFGTGRGRARHHMYFRGRGHRR